MGRGCVFVRYRRYIGSRATKRDKARYAEGQKLLAPLLDEIGRIHAEKAARQTREKNAAEAKAKADAEKAADGATKPAAPTG